MHPADADQRDDTDDQGNVRGSIFRLFGHLGFLALDWLFRLRYSAGTLAHVCFADRAFGVYSSGLAAGIAVTGSK